MREIKFRAWDRDDKKIYEVLSYSPKTFGLDKPHVGVRDIGSNDSEIKYISTNFNLIQYTGLVDKNGREIYEGDIDCEDNGFKSIVCYLERYGAYCFVPVELYKYEDYAEKVNYHYGTDCYFDNARPSKYSNIIGNIYENPELIEVSNNV